MIQGHILGSETCNTFCIFVYTSEHIRDVDTLHVWRKVLIVIGIAFAVFEVATERVEYDHIAGSGSYVPFGIEDR